jgi:hypothetical protein
MARIAWRRCKHLQESPRISRSDLQDASRLGLLGPRPESDLLPDQRFGMKSLSRSYRVLSGSGRAKN